MTNTFNTEAGVPSKAPHYIAFQVRDNPGKKGYWTRIGAAWRNKDGKGFTIELETVPVDGRITLRLPSERRK